MPAPKDRILIIRLGALGDLIFCFQSFYEIRKAHPGAEIALLTRQPFAAFALSLPWIDRVMVETHPRYTDWGAWLTLRQEIAHFDPSVVYDLQGKRRQSILYMLLGGPLGPAWSGAAPLCRYPRLWPPQPGMHFMDFLAAQLRRAGVPAQPSPNLEWFDADGGAFALPERYVVLVPGCSPQAPHKRWPAAHYAELAQQLVSAGLGIVTVGTQADAQAVAEIKAKVPQIIDLSGKTSLFELAGVLRHAVYVVGNDTGPTHLAGIVGASTLALFSGRSNPIWSAPPGPKSQVLQATRLEDLSVMAVADVVINKAHEAVR